MIKKSAKSRKHGWSDRSAVRRSKRPAAGKRRTVRRPAATSQTARPVPESGLFPVVAVGASAGGLEAFGELLRHLPPDPGAAIVLIQHLAPERESLLAEILQKSTEMSVQRIVAGMPLEKDVVHVAPALYDVRIENGTFSTDPKPSARGRDMPIDRLFEVIAEQYGVRAIGVVLSGTLSDGALGLRAIKEAGGMTFAQDPASAAFAEMPKAAVGAGGVDRVLTPERIAREIVRVSRHPYMRQPSEAKEPRSSPGASDPNASAERRLFHILRSGTGVDFSNYRQSTFRRRVHRRMALRRIGTLTKYVDFLRANPQEVDALYEDVLITVTRFFRDPEVFQVLRRSIFPPLIASHESGAPLRVWVPGCSTGEEVYSIAIALFEAIEDADADGDRTVQIFATDISERALQKARTGEYLENSLVDVSEERRSRFFVQTGAGWQIVKRIREVCVFARQNVAADPPFSSIDLVSCRNLLIYLDPTLQERVFPYFHYALKPGGYLMLGRSESVGAFSDLFDPFDRAHRIFVRRPSAPRPFGDLGRALFLDRSLARSPRVLAAAGPATLPLQADRLVLDRYGPPGALVDGNLDVVQLRGRTTRFLQPGPAGANPPNLLKIARRSLVPELRTVLARAKKTGRPVRRDGVRLVDDGSARPISIDVAPVTDPASNATFYLVLFESESPDLIQDAKKFLPEAEGKGKAVRGGRATRSGKANVPALERELASTRRYLQTIIEEHEAANEELKSANEEILSANEELQSTNEELETAKEELQSTNEELNTVNEELQSRNNELTYAHNDLANIFGISLPIVMVGPNGIVRRFTEPAEKIFNLAPTDVGRPFATLHPRLHNVNLGILLSRVLNDLQAVDAEVQDDAGNWYSLRIKPYRTIDNKVEGAIIALFDLRTTEQITRSLDYADALVETVQESLIVLDPELRVRSANRAFYRTFQTTQAETVGRSFAERWQLERRSPELLRILRSVAGDRDPAVNREIEMDMGSTGRRTFLVNARRVQPGAQAASILVVSLEDITERKWAELGRNASEQRYRLLFETAREGIWLVDGATKKILDVNPYLSDLLGVSRHELEGLVPWEAGLYSDSESARRRFEELLSTGFSYDPDVTLRSRSGGEIQIEAVSNVYSVGTSRIVQANMRDLSERNRLKGQLRRAQKVEAIGALAGGIAHDFNNLLNIISAHVELLRRADGDPDKRAQSVNAIRTTLQRGSSVVKQLLTFARRDRTRFEDVQLNALVEEIVNIVRETFPRTVRIETRLAAALPLLRADPNQVQQAVLNLLVNARDAMPEGGRVRLETRRVSGEQAREAMPEATEGEYIELTVGDDGVGMDPEQRKRLFEPFFTTKGESGGQGLGLAVVQNILQEHGALVDVTSVPAKGTCFRILFPVPANAEADSESDAVDPAESSGAREETGAGSAAAASGKSNGGTILLVEDEDLLRNALVELLETEGYRVWTARDGIEAVEFHAVHKNEIGAVILDLGLPKLGGWEAFLRMKAADPGLKGIVVSGNLERERRKEMRRKGLKASLRKPYSPAEILKTVRQVLARG